MCDAEPVATVEIAGDEHADEVGRVFADGFGGDPVMTWVFEEPGRAPKLEVFFGFLSREALVPLGATYLTAGGCAAWTPPGSPEWPADRNDRFSEVLAPVCAAGDLERLGALDAATQAHHPEAEHWYLSVLATVAASRGRGIGTALLAASLRPVDRARLPAYLESTNPRNVSLYERHGFRVTTTIDLPGGPPLTAMWREPKGA
ncbi:GNAT family N-acetyltransferase [soil metagenome]